MSCLRDNILFYAVNFPYYVMQEIVKTGFVEPTSIQSLGWPMALKGCDLIGIAETVSGTTLASITCHCPC